MITEKIRKDMATARKANNQIEEDVLSLLLKTLENAAALKGKDLTEEDEQIILKKHRKLTAEFWSRNLDQENSKNINFINKELELLDEYLK